MANISRSTLLRWINQGVINDAAKRGRNGYRQFTLHEIEAIKKYNNAISV